MFRVKSYLKKRLVTKHDFRAAPFKTFVLQCNTGLSVCFRSDNRFHFWDRALCECVILKNLTGEWISQDTVVCCKGELGTKMLVSNVYIRTEGVPSKFPLMVPKH